MGCKCTQSLEWSQKTSSAPNKAMELLSNAIITFLYQAFLIEQVLNSLGRKQNQVLPPNFRQFWSHVKRSDPISCFCNHHHQEYISKFSQNSMKSQKLNKFGLWNFNQIHFAWWNSNEICFEWWNQYEMIVPKLQEYARIDVRSLKFWILKLVLIVLPNVKFDMSSRLLDR